MVPYSDLRLSRSPGRDGVTTALPTIAEYFHSTAGYT